MKLTIFAKLFLSIFLGMLLTLGAMTASVQWSFRRGFEDYLLKVEEKRMLALAQILGQEYGKFGSWGFLQGNQVYWFELLRQVSGPGRSRFPVNPDGPPDPPPPHGPGFPFPPPPGPHPHGPPRGEFFRNGHLRVLDAGRVQVVGPSHGIEPGSKEIFHPIDQGGNTIGWLGFQPDRFAADELEEAFIRHNTRTQYLILGLVAAVSLLVALLLARQFLRPIRRLANGAKALAAGRYGELIPVSSRDELGQLAGDFNHLARTLKRNEEARRQWVADTSHELRTPLAILRSEVEALQDGIRTATPERLRSLHAEIMGMSKLVDDLYELSVYDLGAMNYRMERLDPAELLGDIAEGFKPRFENKGIRLNTRFDGVLPVSGDAGRLRQLFLNLLENSLRYTEGGGVCEITLEKSAAMAIVDIRDSAPGVPDESLELLFQRFYRADKSRSRDSGGAGLGLAIARNIVEAHGGRILAKHSPLGGLWIRVELPLLPS